MVRHSRGWGGKREGAGSKPGKQQTLSVSQVENLRKSAIKRAKETGRSLEDVVLDIAMDQEAPYRDQLAAAKLYWDKMLISVGEGGEADKALGPQIFIPEKFPDSDEAPDFKVVVNE